MRGTDFGPGLAQRIETFRLRRRRIAVMLLFKPSTRLGFLGAYALVGLAGCAIWPTSRIPEGPHGAAPEVVVTPAPASPAPERTPDSTPTPQTAVTVPSLDAPGPPAVSANGPVIAPPAPPPWNPQPARWLCHRRPQRPRQHRLLRHRHQRLLRAASAPYHRRRHRPRSRMEIKSSHNGHLLRLHPV